MANWLVRDDVPSVLVYERDEIVIKTRRPVSIRQGDEILLLSRRQAGQSFTAYASVRRIESSSASEDETIRVHRIFISPWQDLDTPVPLDVFMFSLTIVKNLARPDLHFRFGYRRIPENDVLSIMKSEPFLSRTAYYQLFNALPDILRSRFLAEEILGNPFQNDVKYQDRLRKLIAFINERVVAAGGFLNDMEETVGQLQLESDKTRLVHVAAEEPPLSPDERPIDAVNLFDQAAAFRDLSASLEAQGETSETTLFDEIIGELESPDRRSIEEHYEAAFRNAR